MRIVREALYEFERGDNALNNLGIGRKKLIADMLDSYGLHNYNIDNSFNVTLYSGIVISADFNHQEIFSNINELYIMGSLKMTYAKQIKKIGCKKLAIAKNLFMQHAGITKLPDSFIVDEICDVSDNDITKLPNNFRVGMGLFLRHTLISELPENLFVGGDLHIETTDIKVIPESATIRGKIFKNIGEDLIDKIKNR
jgi:hypothetical protein